MPQMSSSTCRTWGWRGLYSSEYVRHSCRIVCSGGHPPACSMSKHVIRGTVHEHGVCLTVCRDSTRHNACDQLARMVRPTQKVALLVIDMQVHFGAIMRSEPSLVPNLNDLAAFMRSRGVPIVYTQHGHLDPAAEEDTNVEVAFWAAAGAESLKCVFRTSMYYAKFASA